MKLFRFLWAAALLAVSPIASAATFGTFNLRFDNPGDVANGNGWGIRVPIIAGIIRFHGFDVVGTQEGLPHQMKDLQALLPDHELVSYGRNDGAAAGEHVGVFYRKDKFRKLNSGRFWLSETPNVAAPGWDAMFPRICTWVKFQETSSGKEFCFFCVHFDHKGQQAKVESARMLEAKVKEIAGPLPAVLVGDFNLDQNSEGYKVLHDGGLFTDAYETAALRFALTGTTNWFKADRHSEVRIDHVFLTQQFKPTRYGVLTDTYRSQVKDETSDEGKSDGKAVARVPSDHFPVLVEADWVK